MLRRSFAKMLAGLGFSSQILSTASAKSEEDSLRVATHKDKDKSDRTERYRADAETDYNPTPYYVVQLVEKESPVKEVSKSIEEKDSRIESLIEDSKATTEGKSAVLPEEVNDASGSIEYRGTVYEPMIIETGDVPEKMARDIVERVNSGEYGV